MHLVSILCIWNVGTIPEELQHLPFSFPLVTGLTIPQYFRFSRYAAQKYMSPLSKYLCNTGVWGMGAIWQHDPSGGCVREVWEGCRELRSGEFNEKVKTRRPFLQVLVIALQTRSGALVTAEFVRTIMLICWGFFLAKPPYLFSFILFSQQFYEYHMTCRYNLSSSPFHGRENWGVEKLFTQGQTTSTWLSWDSSPDCLTGRASVSHNGCLVVLSEIGNHGFHFQGGLIWVNSLFLPAALSFFVSQENESDWGGYCLAWSCLLGPHSLSNPRVCHWAEYTYS